MSKALLYILTLGMIVAMGGPAHADPPKRGYELFWSDEFDGTEMDTTKWSHRYLGPRKSAINVTQAITLDGNGHLLITTSREEDEIHTGMIGTQNKFETTFGYFEVRALLQNTHGNWSAFWLQSPTYGNPIGNPADAGTEIDIYECFEVNYNWVSHNIHWDGYAADHKSVGSGRVTIPGLKDGWHIFGLEWTEDEYIFYVDGVETWRTSTAVSHSEEYIVLSMEVGPVQAPIVMANPNFSDSVTFDYVRVYKRAPDFYGNYWAVTPGDADTSGTVRRLAEPEE